MTNPRIAVVGSGANGGAIAAALTEAGAAVIAVDPWPAHIEAIRRDGLSVRFSNGDERVTQLATAHLCELAEHRGPFDVIVLSVKAYDTRWICELVLPYLAEDGYIVAVQNGITLDTVADVVGADRSVGAVIEVAANLMHPGKIVQEAPIWLALGGETPLAQQHAVAAAELLAPAATVTVTDNIRSAKWMKLVANVCELVPSAILDLPLADAIAQPGMYDFMLQTGKEALAVALRNGHRIVPIFDDAVTEETLHPDHYVEYLLNVVLESYTLPSTLTTVLQDWRKDRRAEIDELNGYVVAQAAPADAPLNRHVHDLAKKIESGMLLASKTNVASLAANKSS